MQLPAAVQLILHRLQDAGYQAYAVGGCVRDALRGELPHDWDICSSALPEEVHGALSDLHLIDTGVAHGTVTVRLEGQSYEVTTFRRDGSYSDHRRPDQVEFVPDLVSDLARRDFTINAMAVGSDGQVIDPFDGQADLNDKVLRCVGDPTQRFQEDALRILRALRFAATLDFTIEKHTAAAALAQKELLRYVSAERIYSELNKLLVGPGAARVLGEYVEIFTVLLPEITPCIGFDQKNPCHYLDVWNHTLAALELSQPDRIVRWTLLLHDLGKPTAFTLGKDGIGHFRGHPKISAALAQDIFTRLKADKDSRERICWLVYHHDTPPPTNRPTLLRWMQEASLEDLKRLAEIRRCDGTAHADHPIMTIVRGNTQTFTQLLTDPTLESAAITPAQLAVNGIDLMELGVPQGQELGQALHWLLNQVMDEQCPNEHDALLAHWAEHQKEEAK